MPNDQGQQFEKDKVGCHRKEYKHHGLEPLGIKRGQGGGTIKQILKSESPSGNYYSKQEGEQHHGWELCGRKEANKVSGDYHDKETMIGNVKEQKQNKNKSQNVKKETAFTNCMDIMCTM